MMTLPKYDAALLAQCILGATFAFALIASWVAFGWQLCQS